jgi:hypothetical protein
LLLLATGWKLLCFFPVVKKNGTKWGRKFNFIVSLANETNNLAAMARAAEAISDAIYHNRRMGEKWKKGKE